MHTAKKAIPKSTGDTTRQAVIKKKQLRSVRITRIPVVDKDGAPDKPLQYTEINGALLVPVTDAKLFNTSKSSIHRAFERNELVPYHGNGMVKRNNRSTRVYFNLYEYINQDPN